MESNWPSVLQRHPVSRYKDSCVCFYVPVHFCVDMSVVSAVCNDGVFIWSSTWGTWALKRGLQCFWVISRGGVKNYSFFHHGLSPDGLTLSAGGLAATSLKTDHSAFLCVCYWCVHFFISKQWCAWNPAPFPRTVAFATNFLAFSSFGVRVRVPDWPLVTQSYTCFSFFLFSLKTYYRDWFTTWTTAESNESLGRRAPKISQLIS